MPISKDVDIDALPYLEDILAETHTHRVDWLVGAQEIGAYLGIDGRSVSTYLAPSSGHFKEALRIRSIYSGPTPWNWILRKSDADQYKVKAAAEKKVDVQQNGHASSSTDAKDVVYIKEGSPILSVKDAEAIARSLYDVHTSNRGLIQSLSSLASAVDANTKAQRDQIQAMKDVFGVGDKK